MGRNRELVVTGKVTAYSVRRSKSGSWVHAYTVGGSVYSHFSDVDVAMFQIGDTVRFKATERKLRTGSRSAYFAIDADSLQLLAAPEAADDDGGFLYVLVHPAMQGLRKIGFTRKSPEERAAELSGATGVPGKFRVEWSLRVMGDPHRVERTVHGRLHAHRFGKEFFKVDAALARDTIERAYAELFPDAAGTLDAALQARARIAQAARKEQLERLEAERARQAKEASDEYQWTKRGKLRVHVLREMPRPTRGPGFFQRVFGPPVADNLEIEVLGIRESNGAERWRLNLAGCLNIEDIWGVHDLPTLGVALAQAGALLRHPGRATVNCRLVIDVALLDQPSEPAEGAVRHRDGVLEIETAMPAGYLVTAGEVRELQDICTTFRQRLGRTDANIPVVAPPLPVRKWNPPKPVEPQASQGPSDSTDAVAKPRYPWGSKERARELLKATMSESEIEEYLAQYAD